MVHLLLESLLQETVLNGLTTQLRICRCHRLGCNYGANLLQVDSSMVPIAGDY
jgi:hypothetical protein